MTNYENHRITMIYESIFNESLKNTLIGGVIGGGLGAIAGEVVGGDAGKRTMELKTPNQLIHLFLALTKKMVGYPFDLAHFTCVE